MLCSALHAGAQVQKTADPKELADFIRRTGATNEDGTEYSADELDDMANSKAKPKLRLTFYFLALLFFLILALFYMARRMLFGNALLTSKNKKQADE